MPRECEGGVRAQEGAALLPRAPAILLLLIPQRDIAIVCSFFLVCYCVFTSDAGAFWLTHITAASNNYSMSHSLFEEGAECVVWHWWCHQRSEILSSKDVACRKSSPCHCLIIATLCCGPGMVLNSCLVEQNSSRSFSKGIKGLAQFQIFLLIFEGG